jgi:hypothetical protein
MPKMSRYAKAYQAERLQKFQEWPRQSGMDESSRTQGNDKYYFLHENYVVTRSVFQDEDVVFDKKSEEWIKFCREELDFHPDRDR